MNLGMSWFVCRDEGFDGMCRLSNKGSSHERTVADLLWNCWILKCDSPPRREICDKISHYCHVMRIRIYGSARFLVRGKATFGGGNAKFVILRSSGKMYGTDNKARISNFVSVEGWTVSVHPESCGSTRSRSIDLPVSWNTNHHQTFSLHVLSRE